MTAIRRAALAAKAGWDARPRVRCVVRAYEAIEATRAFTYSVRQAAACVTVAPVGRCVTE